MTTDSAGSGLVRQRTLKWLRRRYEDLEERLSSTWPAPGGETLKDSSAHERWVKDNVALFAEESLLLREIAVRSAHHSLPGVGLHRQRPWRAARRDSGG